METEIKTKTSLKFTFVPTHQTSTGIVIGELQTEGGWTICSIEKTNAEEIIKRNNMHDELVEFMKKLYVEYLFGQYNQASVLGLSEDMRDKIISKSSIVVKYKELIKKAEQK